MHTINLTAEDWFDLIGGISFLLSGITTFAFGRISVRHIEREMSKDGIESPYWDKGLGIRLIMYAMTITRNKVNKVTVFDEQAVIDHARKIDWYLAVFLQLSTATFLLFCIINFFLYGDQYQR